MKLLTRPNWAVALSVLIGAALACNTSVPGLARPTRIPVSTEAAGELLQNLQNITPAPDGSVTVTITQEQFTSLIALELAKNPDAPVKDPQVALQDGQVIFTGTVVSNNLEAEAEVAMTVEVGSAGQPEITIVSASLGGLPIPDSLVQSISKAVSDSLASQITTGQGKVTLTSITIEDGSMTVKGVAAPP